MKKLVMVFLVVALAGAACGGDDDGDAVSVEDSAVAAALADSVMDSEDDSSPITSREDAECFAGQTVGSIGEDRLAELGVTASNVGEIDEIDFTESEINLIVDALGDCIDLEQAMADEFAEDFGQEAADCLAGELGEDLLKDMFALGFADPEAELGEEFFQVFLDAAGECDLPLGG